MYFFHGFVPFTGRPSALAAAFVPDLARLSPFGSSPATLVATEVGQRRRYVFTKQI